MIGNYNYLKLSHQEAGVSILISCNYAHVLPSALALANGSTEQAKSHFYHVSQFLYDLQQLGFSLKPIRDVSLSFLKAISVYLALDINAGALQILDLLDLNNSNALTVLCCAEHPKYLPAWISKAYPRFKHILSPWFVDSSYIQTDTAYIYRSIPYLPQVSRLRQSHDGQLDVTSISSNLHSFKGDCNYLNRRYLINLFSSIDGFKFRWFGRGWFLSKREKLKRANLRYAKADAFSRIRLTKESKHKYEGEIDDKLVLCRSKCVLSLENFNRPPGYYTEKLFEPFTFGSIPITLLQDDHENALVRHITSLDLPSFFGTSLIDVICKAAYFAGQDLHQSQIISKEYLDSINNYLCRSERNTNLSRAFQLISRSIA